MKQTNEIKRQIQLRAHDIWTSTGRRGTLAMGTGAGKSWIAVHEVSEMYYRGELEDIYPILLVVPTEKLRDENWPAEFEKWGAGDIRRNYVKSICFASLKNERGNHYKLVILDEIHRLTELSAQAFSTASNTEQPSDKGMDSLSQFFSENLSDAVMGLTATEPDPKRDPEKAAIIQQVAPVVFRYTLDQAIEEGMIADYEIRVIMSSLDSVNKTIKAGSQKKGYFMTTEASHYQYLEKQVKRYQMLAKQNTKLAQMVSIRTFERNRFIYDLPSKTALAQRVLAKILPGKRTLVFCGSIEQCEALMTPNTFHSKTNSTAFDLFNQRKISNLGVVDAANEGLNFVDLDQILVIKLNSNQRVITQQVGRCLRLRDGHKAIIYILCVEGTADERWLEKSLDGFDRSKIQYFSSKGVSV